MCFRGSFLLNRTYCMKSCHQFRNVMSSSKRKSAYDADGKTSVTIMNRERDAKLMIDTYSSKGFRLNNGVFILGPAIVFPKTVLSWKIAQDTDITKDSLCLFSFLEPKLDLLVVGVGDGRLHWKAVEEQLMELRLRTRVNVELLPVERAVGTYNMLVAEDRWVAAALVPPTHVHLTDADITM